jgi:hypothetical protein
LPRICPLINEIITISGMNKPSEISISDVRAISQHHIMDNIVNCRRMEGRQIIVVILGWCNNQIVGTTGIDNRKIIIMPLIAT